VLHLPLRKSIEDFVVKNFPYNLTTIKTESLKEDRPIAHILDRVLSIPFKNKPWQEFHLDIKMAIINADNSPCRDGGICAAILRALMNSPGLPPFIDIIDCSRGGLLKAILSQGYQYAWILDSTDMRLSPGKWLCFKPTKGNHPMADHQAYMALHYADVAEALAMGDALGIDLPYLEIYCIQPITLDGADHLSAPVERGILEICDSILYSLKRRISENGEDLSR